MISKNERGLTCQPIMWSHIGAQLSFADEDAFRFEIRDEWGNVIGFINADRALRHPEVKWKRERFSNGQIEALVGEYKTVKEAFSAF